MTIEQIYITGSQMWLGGRTVGMKETPKLYWWVKKGTILKSKKPSNHPIGMVKLRSTHRVTMTL